MADAAPKPATDATLAANAGFAEGLPLDDRADFERAGRGLIASPDTQVRDSSGDVIWDTAAWGFLDGDCPGTVNPSLWRQSQINAISGLFEIAEGIYQVRGFDLANMTLIAGDSGWIIIDPLTCIETAAAALALANSELGERPVKAVIHTHSHVDHFGGVLGVVTKDQVDAGDVAIIAPEGFLEESVSENVYAGIAMGRRANYMYGSLLPVGPQGHVDAGLGKMVAMGTTTILPPTQVISNTGDELKIDGVPISFQLTPNTEAPAEMNFLFPDRRALCIAENCTATLHNLYSLRGAKVRDPLCWSNYIDEAIKMFGGDADCVFASHHWPRWGADDMDAFLTQQRDMYRYIHDQSLRMANAGLTPSEIAEGFELPAHLRTEFHTHGYYGTTSHNTRAVYQRYLGFFDGNPANLNPHPPAERARRYVEFMGGADAALDKADAAFGDGDYRWVAEVVNHVVFADPDNERARNLQADALEQLGYQAESGPWRDFYLTGALELRAGVQKLSMSLIERAADMLANMTVPMMLDGMALRLDGTKLDGVSMKMGLDFTDTGEQYTVSVANNVMRHDTGLDADADVTIRWPRTALDTMATAPEALGEIMASGEMQIDGDASALMSLFGAIAQDDPDFPIVTP